ncbi:MAG: tRNA pseudouridine(55) synthase TruB, partial [bacterium]|nr:tRNA pseudouridine(55) synthase TruB [bacterium]
MDGILLINKEKNYTSRDVVNIVGKYLNTKKVGHFGTLDPMATGLLILGVGKYTKFQKVMDKEIKEYEVSVKLGVKTDTYDITGNILEEEQTNNIDFDKLKKDLLSFKKRYYQEVPIYSAVKVNGKKLYEYARCNEKVILPKKEVELYSITNIKLIDDTLYFNVVVSKGFYIRSLINDLS